MLPADRPGVAGAFAGEWQRVLAIRGAFILLIVAPMIYGIYYPQPYLNQILRKLPIAVVDADQSELGRRDRRDAGCERRVQRRGPRPHTRRCAGSIDRGDAFAAVGIPPGTERDVLKGITAHIPIYADATYLFLFRSTVERRCRSRSARCRQSSSPAARAPDGSLVKAKLAEREPGRRTAAADLQPGRRLCQLHRPGGLHADPAADPAGRRGDADRVALAQGGGGPLRACSAAASRT